MCNDDTVNSQRHRIDACSNVLCLCGLDNTALYSGVYMLYVIAYRFVTNNMSPLWVVLGGI